MSSNRPPVNAINNEDQGRPPAQAQKRTAGVASGQISAADLEAVREQLGREPRGVLKVAARCACGAPAVVATAPRLDDGTPFPTMFYLAHPAAVKACSVLEAEHWMDELNEQLRADEGLQAKYRRAHEQYLQARDAVQVVPEISGVSAGGMPTRVKCLHALVGHALAAGPGVNPIGDMALKRMEERGLWNPNQCADK
ncbi:DUF501 domain-containing protein [Gleimia hominis]|uniref:DUF501 domain-containing protein n=1 Tax=Gleimia hominis TaxID=595468 RepID=UPI000C80341F|nr:DUF501 domain-containing protein [Gleimia hominis]WIK63730.1 DUF501 domain-containing protein [Gleimia hominis]